MNKLTHLDNLMSALWDCSPNTARGFQIDVNYYDHYNNASEFPGDEEKSLDSLIAELEGYLSAVGC